MGKNRIKICAVALALLLALAACGKGDAAAPAGADSSAGSAQASSASDGGKSAAPAADDGFEKFSQLEIGMTEGDVNALLGEPAAVDKAYYYYDITVNGQVLRVEVWINTVSGLVTYFNGDFYKEDYRAAFADPATDFSKVDGLDSGALNSYEACAEAFGTPGYLISDDENGVKRYLWVDANDGHLCVSFREDGSVRSYEGYC